MGGLHKIFYTLLIDIYFSYIERCREISNKQGIPFIEIDRVLYSFDKIENKEIPLYRKRERTVLIG